MKWVAKEASAINTKTTVLKIKHIQIENEDAVYAFPTEFQEVSNHAELMKTTTAKRVKAALTLRHERANPIFSLDQDLQKIYLDEDGNPTFKNVLLKEVDLSKSLSEKDAVPMSNHNPKSLSAILKDAVLDKFTQKTCNAIVWLDNFTSKCKRLGIPENRFYEALWLFLTDTISNRLSRGMV